MLVQHSGAVVGSELADWGEVQVRNSADFACGGLDTVCHLYGGINYQIEHHLFPSINHAHLPAIAPIIREACREFGIEHVAYPNTISAFAATIAQYRDVQKDKAALEQVMKHGSEM